MACKGSLGSPAGTRSFVFASAFARYGGQAATTGFGNFLNPVKYGSRDANSLYASPA